MNISLKLVFILGLGFLSSGCGRIWGGVIYGNGNGGAPSSVLSYACSTQVFLEGISNNGNAPATSSGGTVYSVSPALPTGLSINQSSGVISGTPTAVTPLTAYTVTATNVLGTFNTTVNIRTAIGWLVNDLGHDAHNAGGLGSCSAAGFGTCTLRAAIDEINLGGSTRTVVLLPAGTTGNALLTSGLGVTNITQPMDIYGNCASGTTIDGNNTTQIFKVNLAASGPISFNNMTLQNANGSNVDGGALNLTNSGVATFVATLNSITFTNNQVTGAGSNFGGALMVQSAGAAQRVDLTINNSNFTGNQYNGGGGFGGGAIGVSQNSHLIVNFTTFSSNTTVGNGSAIYHQGSLETINQSLFFNNTGAVATMIGAPATGTQSFTNNTYVSNTGCIYQGTTVTITNNTFLNNTVPGFGGGALFVQAGYTYNITNNLFLGNKAGGVPQTCQQTGGTLTSFGGNLADDNTCNFIGADFPNTTALVGALQNNGGPTSTVSLLTGSPGLNQALVGSCPAVDQRNFARHIPTTCDIGAYEHQP